MQEAKRLLLEKGWAPSLVDATLHYIEERSDYSGSVPSSVKYFLVAFDAVMADPRDKKEVTDRAALRERFMPSGTELLATAQQLETESKTSNRSIKTILEERARAGSR